MLVTMFLGTALLAAGVEPDYREAAASAAHDPDAQVRLALWCEARG